MTINYILNIKDLTVSVDDNNKRKILVNNINLQVKEGSITALVGGSGSGKTTTGLSIMRLLPGALRIDNGEIIFKGNDLLSFNETQMRMIRGKEIGLIFQEPLNAFNPVFTIGYQIDEVLKYHTSLTSKQRREKILDALRIVGMTDPGRVSSSYPHQLSGGMRQRAMIAQALAADPKLIIADEPTSSLDVTLQAKIIELFKDIRKKLGLTILLITHDLGMVEHIADDVKVMTSGSIVEEGNTSDIINNPRHLYTRQLMEAMRF